MPPGRDNPQHAVLKVPGTAGTTRLRHGSFELVLERVPGGLCLVCHDGRQGQRYHLGLPGKGELLLTIAPPELPVRVHFREGVALAPRGRLRRLVLVPLPRQLLWRGPDGDTVSLLTLTPPELMPPGPGAGRTRAGVHSIHSPCFLPGAAPWRVGELLLPIHLCNQSRDGQRPSQLDTVLTEDDLLPIRGRLYGRPRRMVLNGNESPKVQVRDFVRSPITSLVTAGRMG